jgi:hypothetical protein
MVIQAYRVTQPAAGPFNHKPMRVLVRPIDFSALTIEGQTEAQFTANRTPKQLSSWESDKMAFTDQVVGGLRHLATLKLYQSKIGGITFMASNDPPGPDTVVVTYRTGALIKGWFDGTATITDSNNVSENLALHVPVVGVADIASFALGNQMRYGGFAFGHEVSRYLADTRSP